MSNRLGNNGGRTYSFLAQPVLIDCNFVVDSGQPNGVRSLKGAGVQNVFMYSTAPSAQNPLTSGTYSPGYALVQLRENYQRYCGGFSGFVSPTTGSPQAINSTALNVGQPYIVASVGHAALGTVTIAPVADVSGSLASKYFLLFDGYGNTFCIWFSVSGVGSAPALGAGVTYVQQSISTGDTAATIGADLVITIENLPVAPGSATNSFTASGTTTVTVVSTQTHPYGPLPGAPQDGASPLNTGFTFAKTVYNTNLTCWQGVGLQLGLNPTVGQAFIATSSGVSTHGGSTGTAIAAGVSGISEIEVIGDANQSIGPVPMGGSPNVGGWVLVQFLAPVTSMGTTTMTPTAPAAGSVVGMTFQVESKAILISGE
jgi:hypothetical protein